MNIRNGLFWEKEKEHRKAQLIKEVKKSEKQQQQKTTPQSKVTEHAEEPFPCPLFIYIIC